MKQKLLYKKHLVAKIEAQEKTIESLSSNLKTINQGMSELAEYLGMNVKTASLLNVINEIKRRVK